METKKKRNILPIIMLFSFIIFICLYFMGMTDIYKYKEHNRMIITKESMEKFEKDVESGKDITINDYLENVKDYSNVASNLGYKTSNFIEEIMCNGIRKTFKVLASLFT